jgi:serine/threonine protein kinase
VDIQTHASISPIATQRRRIVLPSQVAYDLVHVQEDGFTAPRLLGAGRFAKVYAAQQVIAGQPSRTVAIKILHDHADYHAERLFDQEVALNREFSTGPTQGVPSLVDIVTLEALVMCGCGALYHPTCPRGCGVRLTRRNLKTRPYPALHCSKCDYELSAERVDRHGAELYGPRAKPCCTAEGDLHANAGTIVNFALRTVMVMECLEVSLADHATDREDRGSVAESGAAARALHYFGLTPTPRRQGLLDQKVRLLGKVNLMVQIAETVAWLHGEEKVVHKDLAPDNVMIRHSPCDGHIGSFAGDHLAARLDQAANACTQICVIDFGLSDKEKLTRAWYEDAEISMAVTKLPYLSPESRHRRQSIGVNLEFDAALRRFRVPPSLEQSPASIRMHDIIADSSDDSHAQDLVITRIEEESGHLYAYFQGSAPRGLSRHLEIVRPLGEAHDVYALGAIFYFILTGRHDQVEKLSNLVGSIQDQPCPLDRFHLARRDNYANRRSSILEPFWRDELMVLILRAMVRGRPESFAADRTVRGPEPAQRFLTEVKRIQQGLIAEAFAERSYARTTRLRRWTSLALAATLGAAATLRGEAAAGPSAPGFVAASVRAAQALADRPAEAPTPTPPPAPAATPVEPPAVAPPASDAAAPTKSRKRRPAVEDPPR